MGPKKHTREELDARLEQKVQEADETVRDRERHYSPDIESEGVRTDDEGTFWI